MIYDGALSSLSSGYTRAALEHLCSLVTAGYDDIVLFPAHGPVPWNAWPNWVSPLRGAQGKSRDVVLVHTTPDALASVLKRGDARYVGMTAIDTDRVPRWAAIGINKVFDRLIVPSRHSREAALLGGVTIPVLTVPHTMGEHAYMEAPADRLPGDRYRFYYIGSWNARKNPEGALRAFCRTFAPDDGAGLSLKLTGADSFQLMVEDIVREEERSAGRSTPADGRPRVDVVIETGHLSERHLQEWHVGGDCYVSSHRGEAFGLAVLEAALRGKPVIATKQGGPCEFLSEARGDVFVEGAPVPVTGMSGLIQFSGRDQRWVEPDIEAFGAAMHGMFDAKKRRADPGVLRERHTWETLGPVLRDAIGV